MNSEHLWHTHFPQDLLIVSHLKESNFIIQSGHVYCVHYHLLLCLNLFCFSEQRILLISVHLVND